MRLKKELFMNYMLERAEEGMHDEVKQLILEGFERSENESLDRETFDGWRNQMLTKVKSKFIEEVVTNVRYPFFDNID